MRSRRGFTLIEVLVALTLGSMVVLAAHAAFGGALDASARLDEHRLTLAAELRGRAWLTRAAASLDPSSPGSVGFDGSPNAMRFSTWLRKDDGRFVLQSVAVEARHGKLEAAAAGGGAMLAQLADVEGVTFDYLLESGAESRWVQAWHSPVSAPVAVRLRLRRGAGVVDTLLLAVGTRG